MAENNPLLEIDGLGSPKEESNPLLQIDGLGESVPDVKKKEQTKPTQAAPLPGLGGVSEEPTPSPSVGQGVLRNVDQTQIPIGEEFIAGVSDLTRQPSQTEPTRVSGAGGTFVTKEDAAPIIGYEENQKALSDIDKQISNNQQQGRFIDPTRQKRLKELQAERDILKKRSDQLISETNKDVSGIISKGIGDDWEDFTNELGDIDVSKIGDFARQEALNYGLPEDGYFFERVKNAAKAKVELEKISPTTESFFLGGERRSPEGIVRKKDVQLPGYDSPSTVLMSSYGPYTVDGKHAAFPTLFPKDPKRQTSDPNDWIVAENDDEAYRIAKERGEVLYFDTQKEADAMAEGSWKKIKGTYEEMYGVKPGDDAENMLSREDTRKALGLSKLDAEFSEQMAQLNRDISRSSTQEIEAVSQDRYGMPIDEYVSQLGQGYERSVNEVESRYSSLIQDGKFVGSQDQYDAYQQDLQSVRSGYGSQFNDVVSQNMRDVAAVNNKANRRFNRQRDEILQAYKTEYTDKAKGINPILQERYQKAYNKALDKAMEVENVKKESRAMLRGKLATGSFMGGIGASGIISGASGQMSSIFRAMGMKEGAEFWEQAAINFDIGDTEIKGWKDILDPKKLIKSTSFTLGGMAPMLAASTGVGMVTGGVGGGAMLTTLAAGTAGFGVETMSITQDAYDQKFKETGSVAKAEEAANKSFNGQVMLMPMYALGMAPFFGNIGGKLAKIGMNNAPARFIAGGVMETVSELGQEYPQQLFEQAIADDKELSAAFDYASVEGFKSTVLNVAPTTFLLGGGGAATQKGETSKEDMAKALAMKVNIGELTETAMEQKMLSMTVNAGEKFSKAFVATQLMEGNITEEQAERATSAIESSVATIEKGKEYNLDNKNNYILATLDLKLKAAKAKAESESDPMMKGIAENKVKKIEKQAQKLMETGNVDVALVTYPDGSFDILTHDEARLAMSKDEFMESFSSGDLKVEAMGESQAKLMSELQEKAKAMEPEAAPTKQKGRLTKFSTPQDGIVGEVTYEDGTKKELTQEEYDALEKQEGLFDVETGTQPVAETTQDAIQEPSAKKVDEPPTGTPTEPIQTRTDKKGRKIVVRSESSTSKQGTKTTKYTSYRIEEGKEKQLSRSGAKTTVGNLRSKVEEGSIDALEGLDDSVEVIVFEERSTDKANAATVKIEGVGEIEIITNGPLINKKQSESRTEQDAIQEQAAGKVPVQPEAKAGEKVEEGKPKTEAEKPTQEGKEEVSEEEVNKVADTTGTKPKNIRDLYNINRDMFGQDRVKSLASAIVMDRAIAVMAKRAGISKAEMYSRLEFRKAGDTIPDGVKFQVDAWHGSPFQFDKFTTEKIGTGEGAQAFGWGLYFTDLESIAINYAEILADRHKISSFYFKVNGIDVKNPIIQQVAEQIYKSRNIPNASFRLKDAKSILDNLLKSDGIFGFNLGENLTQKQYDGAVQFLENYINGAVPSIELISRKPYKYKYKVSLHKVKSPSEYTWLEWDKGVDRNLINLIKSKLTDEQYKDGFFDTVKSLGISQERYIKDGETLYNALTIALGSDKAASLFLLENGIDGIKYPAESISRGATSDTARGFNYVVFDENAVSIEEVIKFQKDAQKARGAAMVNMDGTAVIYAMTDPNVSTPLHEIAHVFEHYLTDAERKAIMKFAGTKEWSVETSEKFARGFEKYLADGIAPTAELQKIFDKFKQWMLDIYNGITGSDIDIQLNDEMRDIYDKMLGKEPVAAKTESEKVKAAKDKLSSAWEKWKQSQNNLGIAFDPKSKANEDMELLEAFLTYIKALGIKTAKDIQKAFNDFTGGEATLDDVGAEFIANKVNPKKGETNYEKTEDMNRKDLSKRGKSLFNAAKKLFMDFRRTFVKFSSDTRELLKSTTDIRPVYDYFVARLGSPGNANLIFQEAKKKIYDGIFPNLRKHLDSLIKYRRIITINESRVESNRKGLGSLKASEIFEKAGDEAVNAFNEAVSVANDYANSTEQQALDARGIRNEALRSLRQSEWYKSLSELKQKRFEKQLREDIGFLKNENFTGKDSNGNPIGLSVAREMLSEIEVVVGKKDFNKINERAELYFDEFKKMLEKDLKKGIISQEQYDAMIGKDYSPRVFIQHMFGFDGEFIENIDEARLMKEYSLSSDAIRTLREGLKDLNTNEAYWELITDSENLLAGYISSRERRYAFNDLNKKMVSVLSKFEAEFNELKKKDKLTKEERLRYKKLGNILDAFSTERKRGMSSANYYENGEKKSFYIRDDIFKQWYDMRSTVRPDGTATKLLDNLFQTPQRILQSFATGEAAPFFFVFNTARDFVQLSVISDVYGNWTFTPISMAKAMKDFAKGAYHIFMDDALYREAMENGVGMDFLYMEKGLGLRKMMKDSLLKLAEKSDITRVGSMALTKGINAMSSGLTAANRYSELGFRIAIYERVRDAEYKKIEAAKDKMTDEEYLEAKQDARKKAAAVSRDFMNFSEGGSFTKKVNPYASYLNAAVIGTDTVVKEFRKNPPAFTFRVAQGTTILSTAMLGMGLMMLNMFDEDDEEEGDDKDKQYGTLKKYYKILDSVSPYYRNKFYIIPTGRKDENGNYEVIRIAKNPALIPISYAAEKALRYNLEKQLLGSEERYSSENLKKDALEINYLFHEYVMPINLSPVDENGDTGLGLVSNLAQKNIPLSLMIIAMTGYDPYTNRYISPEKKYQSELDSKYLIGWNDPEIQGFYKDMAMELNTSITPKEMKVMVEKIITRPENNPIIASVYSMLDRNNKTSDIIKKDRSLVSDILNMTKKVAVISADYEEYAKKPKTKKIEEKIREHKEEKYATSKIPKTVVYDIIKKVKNKEIDALDIDTLVSEMDKMVSTQIDVFKEANVEISERDEMEIRHKVYRNAVPALNLPELPTQYKLTYVVDRDPVVMAYRFFEDFGDVDVQGDQFKEISAQMMNEYRGQYNSVMSKDKFNKFLTKYIEAKNDPELIGN
jgi:hypothetical protein